MKNVIGIVTTIALLLPACVIHNQPEGEGAKAAGEPSAGGKTAASGTAAEEASPDDECTIPEGLTAGAPALGMPQIVAPESVTLERESAMLELDENGTVRVTFELNASNTGSAAATVTVGFVWRIQETGPGTVERMADVEIKLADAALETCVVESPAEIHQPFRDQALYTTTEIAASERLNIKGSYVAQIAQADKPKTLFGYRDRFGNNWKNWDWPYTKSKAYAEIADELKPFYGTFALGRAERSQITIRSHSGENWIRTMSHEQVVEQLRMQGTYRWAFWGGGRPNQVEFEYVVGLPMQREIKTFRAIVKANRYDLRARIRLADLAGFAGDLTARAEIIEGLLKVWKRAAKEQLLVDSNDVRGPAYVALVKSLKSVGRNKEAAEYAQAGVDLIRELEAAGQTTEMNRLAREWLEKQ